LIHVATPIDICEGRDRKGLYAKARAAILKEFTGISDPYEGPVDADIVIDTTSLTPSEAAEQIVLHLEKRATSERRRPDERFRGGRDVSAAVLTST
jgi:sulfate adenylyltransferase